MTNSQLLILLGAGALAVVVAGDKLGDALNAINPANNDNIFRRGQVAATDSLIGQDNRIAVEDTIFGALDLLNPWAPEERKRFARQVFRWEEPSQ